MCTHISFNLHAMFSFSVHWRLDIGTHSVCYLLTLLDKGSLT